MELRKYSHWIFDMDGTLTLPVHDFESIRRELGIRADAPILEAIGSMNPAEAAAARARLHDLEMELAGQARPQPGVGRILDRLLDRGKKVGILTRNGEEIGHATLRAAGLNRYFDREEVIGRETCAPKPYPDGVHYLLGRWNAPKESTLIVGDYLYDMQAGHAAGISTVHFDSLGEFRWPEYTHYRIRRMDQLLSMM